MHYLRPGARPWGNSAHIPVRPTKHWGTWEDRLTRRNAAAGLLRGRAGNCGQHSFTPGGKGSGSQSQRVLCGSPVCPVCGPRIWNAYRSHIQEAIQAWRYLGGRILMLTITVPHTRNHDLNSSLTLLARGWTHLWSGRPGRRLRQHFGIEGAIRVLEIQDGAQGWHPHYHALLFVPASTDVDSLKALATEIGDRWASNCTHMGRKTSQAGINHLVHIKWLSNPHLFIADYLTKGPARVIAALADRAQQGDRRARARWRELQDSLRGRTRVLRTPGIARLISKALKRARRRKQPTASTPVATPQHEWTRPLTPRCRSPSQKPLRQQDHLKSRTTCEADGCFLRGPAATNDGYGKPVIESNQVDLMLRHIIMGTPQQEIPLEWTSELQQVWDDLVTQVEAIRTGGRTVDLNLD